MSTRENPTPPPRSAADGTAGDSDLDPWRDLDHAANLDLREFPSFLLLRLGTAIQRSVMPQYTRQVGLSLPEWRLLPLLARVSPLQLSALTSLSTLDKALVSRAVRLLSGKGLATVMPDPAHGRRLVIAITPAGQALHDKVLPDARKRQIALLSVLDAEERSTLYRAINKLTAALDASSAADGAGDPS
jgi:DNA-binding MarR family transcriptional regulator